MSVYCTQSDVEPLVKFIDDDASTDLFDDVCDKADSWINSRLIMNSLHTFEITDDIPELLTTAASYYAVSDIVLALYQGEDMLTQYDIWFQKAEDMINSYITQQKDLLATTELKHKNPVRHSKAQTYYQKKHRRPML